MKLFSPAKLSRSTGVSKVKTSFKVYKAPSMKTVRMTVVKPPKMSKSKVTI